MRRVLLLVDLSYQAYRAAAANPGLTCEGTFTGGLYGFLTALGAAARETGATRVAFCRDAKPYVRSLEYPEYKMLRKKAQDPELKERMLLSELQILRLLEKLGHEPLRVPGFESDDIIMSLTYQERNRFDEVYAFANDSDLYQGFWVPNFSVYHNSLKTAKRGANLACPVRKLPISPEDYMLATALMGTHNDIAGIPGVAETRAFDAVRDPVKLRQLRAAHGDVIERNLKLIRLPHRDFPGVDLPGRPPFVRRDLYAELGRYDIVATQPMERAFEAFGRAGA